MITSYGQSNYILNTESLINRRLIHSTFFTWMFCSKGDSFYLVHLTLFKLLNSFYLFFKRILFIYKPVQTISPSNGFKSWKNTKTKKKYGIFFQLNICNYLLTDYLDQVFSIFNDQIPKSPKQPGLFYSLFSFFEYSHLQFHLNKRIVITHFSIWLYMLLFLFSNSKQLNSIPTYCLCGICP